MSQQIDQPLRGEAAFRAARLRVAKAPEADCARGRVERAADAAERPREAERRTGFNVPKDLGER